MLGEGLVSEISEYQKELLDKADKIFPKEYVNFLKTEGQKLTKVARKIGKREVTGEDSRNGYRTVERKRKNGDIYDKKIYTDYHKGFKRGKVYDYNGSKCIRAYNSTPHAHLLEYGHNIVARGENRKDANGKWKSSRRKGGGAPLGRTAGKYVFTLAEYEFADDFTVDCEKFLFEFMGDEFKGTHI